MIRHCVESLRAYGIDLLPEEMLAKLDDLFLQNQVTPQVISDAVSAMSVNGRTRPFDPPARPR